MSIPRGCPDHAILRLVLDRLPRLVAAALQQRELHEAERKLANRIEGVRPPGLQQKPAELERRYGEFATALASAPPPPPALPDRLAERYRDEVASLADTLGQEDSAEAKEAARALIEKVIIHPASEPDGPPEIELVGDLAALLALGGA